MENKISLIICAGILFFNAFMFIWWAQEHHKVMRNEKVIIERLAEVEKQTEIRQRLFNNYLDYKIKLLDNAIDSETKRLILINKISGAVVEQARHPVDRATADKIARAVEESCVRKYGLPAALILAQIKQESDFQPHARSWAGAKGLLQIMDPTAKDIARILGKKTYNIWDIKTNIEFGCYYMADLLQLNNQDLEYALRSYNFGPVNVRKVKQGELNYAKSRTEDLGDDEVELLTDRKGEFQYDDWGNWIEVKEEHRYPRETRNYLKNILKDIKEFEKYGFDLFN